MFLCQEFCIDLEYKKDKQMQKISKFQFTFTGSMCKISCDEIKIMSNTYSANKLLVQESMNSKTACSNGSGTSG